MRHLTRDRHSSGRPALLATAALAVLWTGAPVATAEDAPRRGATPAVAVEVGQPSGLVLQPQGFTLHGRRATQQLVLTGEYGSAEQRDLTHAAEFQSSDAAVVAVEGSVARPVADGKVKITAKVGGLEATVDVTVAGMDAPSPVTFKYDTLASLTKAGCNMGACHGSPTGKGGFRLSLRGFDPPLDVLTLRNEFYGRRVNLLKPAESLLLKKPLMEVAHGGGRRLFKDDPTYRALHDWIGEGMQVTDEGEADLLRLEIVPKKRILRDGAPSQQTIALGHFSDGSVRDLTPLTVFESSSESVATVSATGLVEKGGRGETAILARYLDKMDNAEITFLEEVPGFVWNDPPEHNFIDTLVFKKLQQLQILPSELCSDEEFVRRAYLDAAGRLPTIEEALAFLDDTSADKRNVLIDRLLDSDDYAHFWTLKWGDVLRSNSKKLKLAGVHKFRRWIYDSIRTDKPLDRFARELLTASGSVYENPPANYWRASRDTDDAVETTAQLFLGVRIQCAKCHNHPFERWSQDNYYGIAAAFVRIGRKPGTVNADDEVIYATSAGEVTQPRTGQQMKVHLLLKGEVDVPADQDRRRVFAEWLTDAENPFFARAAVNRLWGHLMGRGLVDPVDDFRDSNPPSNAELLDTLSAKFIENGYSQKWVVREIMRSRTYQFSSRKNEFNADDELYNSHYATRLLSAEQLLDAICQVTGLPENFPGLPPGTPAVRLADPPTDHYFLKIFGQPQREMACECERSSESNLSQALQMINGPVVHNKLRDDKARIARLMADTKPDEEIITTLYLAALSRRPTPEELQAAQAHLAATGDRKQALEDIGWAVLNSKEFLFQH